MRGRCHRLRLGLELDECCQGGAHLYRGAGRRQLDLADAVAVGALVEEVSPTVVFLAGAFTHVDGCEQEPQRARQVNVEGARASAAAAKAAGALLVFYSSEYVFDGKHGPFRETDTPQPLSVYGRTKLEAERAIETSGVDAMAIRSCGC